jgi:hypothetical protein
MICVNRITIQKDGVYVSSYDYDGERRYRVRKDDDLTDIYNEGRKNELDKALLYMFCFDDWNPCGSHDSVAGFREVLDRKQSIDIICKHEREVCKLYRKLTPEDVASAEGSPTDELLNVYATVEELCEGTLNVLWLYLKRYEKELGLR